MGRLGNDYRPAQLQQALEYDRTLFEHRDQDPVKQPIVAMVRPMANLGLHLADMAAWPRGAVPNGRSRTADWLEANDGFRRRVLDQLRASGPLAARDIPDSADVPWASTGWTNDRNVTQLLGSSRRREGGGHGSGPDPLWTSPSGCTRRPRGVPPTRPPDTRRAAARSLGVAPRGRGEAGNPAEVEGTAGGWRVDPEATADGFEGRTALLSPFDRLIHDRARAAELFDFDYILEMYKPKAKRRWGYFALPVLHHHRLVGKVDAAADRKGSVLQVHAVHQDIPFTPAVTAAVDGELDSLARWLGLDEVRRS